jgi:excisionase family DNA binding protein
VKSDQADVPAKDDAASAPLTITIRRAQELSGLSRATINRLMWSGKLRSTTVGSRRLIEYASFVEALGLNRPAAA